MFFEEILLESTGDKRDRAPEIEKILKEKGVCILGTGDFTVSGIEMPDRTSLKGLGEASRILLDDAVEEGYAVKMGDHCRVSDLTLCGASGEWHQPTELGGRHGVGFVSNFTSKVKGRPVTHGILHALHIHAFSGGGITCTDTGYSCEASLSASDIRIERCGAGINISHFSEYHRFSGVQSVRNLYGCINNGGNNVFSACAFDGNTVGFLIDNSRGQSGNNSHGSAVGCTFNHSDSNNGVGIMVLGAQHGFVFSACQLFYSKIVLEDSVGIQITDLNGGRAEEIHVKGGSARFSGCNFSKAPRMVIDQAKVAWESGYFRNGDALTLKDMQA